MIFPISRRLQVEVVLQIKPEVRRRAEGLAQTKGSVSGDAHVFRCNPVTRRRLNGHLAGDRASGQLEWNKKFFAKDFSSMYRRKLFGHSLPQLLFVVSSGSVIVGYLNLRWAFQGPNKANPELVV